MYGDQQLTQEYPPPPQQHLQQVAFVVPPPVYGIPPQQTGYQDPNMASQYHSSQQGGQMVYAPQTAQVVAVPTSTVTNPMVKPGETPPNY